MKRWYAALRAWLAAPVCRPHAAIVLIPPLVGPAHEQRISGHSGLYALAPTTPRKDHPTNGTP